MRDALRAVRSFVSVMLVGLLFALFALPLRLTVIPLAWLVPRWRFRLVSTFMHSMCRGIVLLLTLGGARFRRHGEIPTGSPLYVVANHQALLDIVQVTLLSRPRVPAFVTRTRYARFVPLVSACIRLLGCPLVDPKRDPRGALEAVRRGARDLPHGLLIFPEGHRSTTGEVRPFRSAGLLAMLDERRLPVYVVVNDGTWRVRRLTDLLFRVHVVDADSEVLGPWEPPADAAQLPEFVQGLREAIANRLADLRNER
jgi:1-acyl-sn-glycerol-3-phosphate acyltransferase